MNARLAVLVAVVLAAAGAAGATEIVLRNGLTLDGRVIREDLVHMTVRVQFPDSLGGGSGTRKVAWSAIRSIDGLSIADWKRQQAERPPIVEDADGTDVPAAGQRLELDPRDWLRRYSSWIAEGEGFGMVFRLGALVLLVLLPGLLLLLGGRWLCIEHVDRFRSFGGAVVGLGVGTALYRVWPGWVGAWPLGAMAGVAAAVFLVLRPPPVRGLVLAALQLVGLAGAVLITLAGSGRLS